MFTFIQNADSSGFLLTSPDQAADCIAEVLDNDLRFDGGSIGLDNRVRRTATSASVIGYGQNQITYYVLDLAPFEGGTTIKLRLSDALFGNDTIRASVNTAFKQCSV